MAEIASWRAGIYGDDGGRLAPLIGREAELARLADRLRDPWVRLVTLVGCPGVGKSALAFHAAVAFYEVFRGAVVVADPARRAQPPLLVLDGADAAGAAALVERLLAAQPGTKLLVTRRAPLRLRGEVVVPVAPLETPEEC